MNNKRHLSKQKNNIQQQKSTKENNIPNDIHKFYKTQTCTIRTPKKKPNQQMQILKNEDPKIMSQDRDPKFKIQKQTCKTKQIKKQNNERSTTHDPQNISTKKKQRLNKPRPTNKIQHSDPPHTFLKKKKKEKNNIRQHT